MRKRLLWASSAVAVLACGCMPEWVRNSVWDTTAVGRYTMRDAVTTQVIRSISIQDMDDSIISEPPKDEDLVVQYSDYILKPNDIISISVFELLFEGYDQAYSRQISELGFVTVPILGTFKASGKTTRQLEVDIANRLRGEILVDPQVNVQLLSPRQEFFNALGGIRPGQYPLDKRNMRLVDVVAMLGDVQNPDIRMLYVIRQRRPKAKVDPRQLQDYQPAPKPAASSGLESLSDLVRGGATTQPDGGLTLAPPPPPPEQPRETDLQAALAESALGTRPTAGTAPAAPAAPLPAPAADGAAPAAEGTAAAADTGRSGRTSVWVSGRGWVEVAPQKRDAAAGLAPDVDWEALQQSMPVPRIIGIPVEDLRRGDPRYNIVMRDGDLLYAPNIRVGEFYVMGQVARPGAYLFNGRDITLKQAVASAGNLAGLAWPTQCQLVRRIGQDREEHIVVDLDAIFAGNAPDIYMKPQDLLNVGTNFAATFLAGLRNGFNANYGFSFTYERNFYGVDGFDLTPNDSAKEAYRPGHGSFMRRLGGGLLSNSLTNLPTALLP